MALRRHLVSEGLGGIGCHSGCLLLSSRRGVRERTYVYGVRTDDLARLICDTRGMCMLCCRAHASIVEHCH